MNAEAERRARGGARGGDWGRLLLKATILVLAFLAMVGFSVVLAKVTLTPSPASEDLVRSNLHPGRSLRQYAVDYTFLAACKQAGGNLVLGMPFGVLLPVLVPRRLRMIRMVLLTVLVIVVVELVQGALVAGRAFDVDDVILNTAGALLGYLLLGRRLSHRYHVLAAGPERPETAAGTRPAKDTAKATRAKKAGTTAEPKPKGTAKAKAASKPRAKAAGTTARTATKPRPRTARRPGREPRGGRPAMSWPRMWQGIRTRVTSRSTRRE